MSLLSAKKISVEDYLDYLDIIEEEEEDKNSNYYDELERSKNKNKKNMVSSSKKKTTKGNKTSERYRIDPNLYISDMNSEMGPVDFDDEMEPQPADFHKRPRNQSEDYSPNHHGIDELGGSGREGHPINRSDHLFKKHKDPLSDMVVISLDSGDNDEPSLG